jgi:mono/diheme cytochrome c family protein
MKLGVGVAFVCAAAILGLAVGCSDEALNPDQMARGVTSPPLRQLNLGREVYGTYCVGCHGEKGDGNGPAARFLETKPRDFRIGRLKFANVSSGEAPRDEDYLRIITQGLAGTAMPSFSLLSGQERAAVVAYLRRFSKKKQFPGRPPAIGGDPFARDPARGVAVGKATYHATAKCWSCHQAYAPWPEISRFTVEANLPEPEPSPGLYESHVKDSEWGVPILPPDFLSDRIKTGTSVEGLVQVISAGVGGTAMPTWGGVLDDKQLWGLAYYVRSLALLRGTARATALRSTLEQPAAVNAAPSQPKEAP